MPSSISVLTILIGATLILSSAVYTATSGLFSDTASIPGNTFATANVFNTGPMELATGSYTGDGVDGRLVITGSFQPDVVFIKCDCRSPAIGRTSTMTGDSSKILSRGNGLQANLIESFTSNGFVVGGDNRVNRSNRQFHRVAMKAGDELSVGSYTGDGNDDRAISGVGFSPVWLMTIGDGNNSLFRPATLPGDASYTFTGTGQLADRIQSLDADGFQVGANRDVNRFGGTYHYIAWNSSSKVQQSTYLGDGTDDRSIATVGFSPLMVWLKNDVIRRAVWRPQSLLGDLTLEFTAAAASADLIQALESNGMQIGADDQVNASSVTYHYIAFRN